jgi:radical SAM-linked protein
MSERRWEKAQRLRVRFARAAEAGAVGHLDLSRIWERALEAAGVAVSYSQGNRPHPRLVIAAGLPVGVTSEGELLDVTLAQPIDPLSLPERLAPHLPEGLRALEAWEVGLGLPALPAVLRWADYEVDAQASSVDVDAALRDLLSKASLPWEDTRGERTRRYDLRPLVGELRVERRCGESVRLAMRLRCEQQRIGRADQVVKALGLPPATRVHRVRLVLAEASPAREAWRRRGRFVE